MNIEIKNLKIAASLSEETTAYTADIFVDGVKTFAASNHGHGGCDMYHRLPGAKVTEADVNAWLADNCPPDGPYSDETPRSPYDMGTTCNLETYVGRFVGRVEGEKESKRIRATFDRMLRDRICALNAAGAFVTFGKKGVHLPTPEMLGIVRTKNPDITILNDADDATKLRGLLAYCPNYGEAAGETDAQLAEAVYERLRTDTLTVADAKWLLADPQSLGGKHDADVDAHLRQVIERGEAAYAAYCAERDATHARRA